MAQSLVKVYIHLVFHIKTNSVMIQEKDREELYAYMMGIIRHCNSIPIRIGGTNDHVHILCTLPRDILIADFVKKIKHSSSSFLKEKDNFYFPFYWQAGYGAFSVSSSIVDKTIAYIDNQMMHHHTMTFREEYTMFLKEYGIDYNEDYVVRD